MMYMKKMKKMKTKKKKMIINKMTNMILSRSPTVEQQLNYSISTIYAGCGNGFGCSYEETKMTVGHFFM